MNDIFVVELSAEVARMANGILRRNTLRAADAIHLASCLWLRRELGADLAFIAFDARLTQAAMAEGLAVEP